MGVERRRPRLLVYERKCNLNQMSRPKSATEASFPRRRSLLQRASKAEKGGADVGRIQVTSFNNETYATNTTAPQWKIFWQYPQQTSGGNNVHAFSNIKVDGDVFPVGLKSVKQIDIDMQWTMRTDNDTGPTDEVALKAATVNSNVAVDMFIDGDKSKAEDSTKAKYEVMVWFAALWRLGPNRRPRGRRR